MSPTILVVEDEPDILALLQLRLEMAGYLVQTATTGSQALQAFAAAPPDLVLLDVMLPEVDGLEVCRRLRERADVPVILVTAKDQLGDKLRAFELGADDYVTKPFHVEELLARIRLALQRRGVTPADAPAPDLAPFRLDPDSYQLFKHERLLDLSRTEFELFRCLAATPGRTVPRERLQQVVWGDDRAVLPTTLTTFIRKLRAKVEDDPRRPRLIKTVHGIGYRLELPGGAPRSPPGA